ncbi:MAG: hypothetical protein ACFBSE_11805, partial [Prochloraceae cyanobacterium]
RPKKIEKQLLKKEKPFHKRPGSKIGLSIIGFFPLFLLGVLLIDRPSPLVAQKPVEETYTREQINKLNKKIKSLENELYSSKSSEAFMSDRIVKIQEPIQKPTPAKEKKIAQKAIEIPSPPPPVREYNFTKPVEKRPTKDKPEVMGRKVQVVQNPRQINSSNRVKIGNDLLQVSEAALLQEIPLEPVRPQSVKAVLSTPIVTNSDGQIYNKSGITVTLLEDLTNGSGKTLVKANTEILVKAKPFGSSLLVNVNAIAFMGNTEFAIPERATSISGYGTPIAAQPLNSRNNSGVTASEVGGIVLSEFGGNNAITRGLSGILRRRNRQTENSFSQDDVFIVKAGFPLEFKIMRSFEVPISLAGSSPTAREAENNNVSQKDFKNK